MGLDIGDRRIGVAVSDPGGILANPLVIIERRDDERDIQAIKNIVQQYEIGRIVAGLPLSLDGTIGPQAEKVRSFIDKLKEQSSVPVEMRDERLTTVSARRFMREANPKKRKVKRRDDAFAAALILQGYLDETGNK